MEAVRAAVLSCQHFTALYLCSPKLSVWVELGVCSLRIFTWTETISSPGRKLSSFLLDPLHLRGVQVFYASFPGVNIVDNLQLHLLVLEGGKHPIICAPGRKQERD